jgi:gliding motility-associated-like protein
VVTINTTPVIPNPINVTACDSYALPALTVGNYFTATGGTGTALSAGASITSTQTVYIYAQTGTTPNCTSEKNFVVTINISPVVSFSSDINSGCLPLTVTFTNNTIPIGQSVTWNFGDGTIVNLNQNLQSVTHTFQTEDCFDIQLTSTNDGCSTSNLQVDMICAHAYAVADFSADKVTSSIVNPTFYFTNTSSSASLYSWSLSDGFDATTEDLNHTFPSTIDSYYITLIANNIHNCPDTITKSIDITDELIFYVPNAFTPDDDNANPKFTPVFSGGFVPEEFVMYIFNRWGEVIFETHDASKGWAGLYGIDGKICQDDVYVWKIEFKEKTTYRSYTKTGHVSLLR